MPAKTDAGSNLNVRPSERKLDFRCGTEKKGQKADIENKCRVCEKNPYFVPLLRLGNLLNAQQRP
eukprot:11216380-Lingulodinium_polyedra.AAC.1